MRSLVMLVVSCAALAAQHVVVPPEYADANAPHAFELAGSAVAGRHQIVIDARHLTAMQGGAITELAFRRNPGRARTAGQVRAVVRLATPLVAAVQALPDFASNVRDSVVVFDGVLSLPASPAASIVDWSVPNRIDVPLSAPWAYPGAGIAVDIDGLPIGGGVFWPIDAAGDPARGTVASLGGACGPLVQLLGETAWASAGDLVPGRTARFLHRSVDGAVATLLVGLQPLPVPIDLGFLGAVGCTLQVDAFAAVAAPPGVADWSAGTGVLAGVTFGIPARSELAGARLAVQWAALSVPLTTSNALSCTLASAVPSPGIAIVARAGQGATEVDFVRAPVVRFALR